jgi:hypothetical protein
VRSWSAILTGAIGLAVLDAVVSRQQAASNVGGFLAGLGGFVHKVISPQVPAFATGSTTPQPSSGGVASSAIPSVTMSPTGATPSPISVLL